MDVMVMADSISHFNTGSLSSEDVERLRSLLPPELQQSGKLSHLEIIMEAISYIKMLQNQLGTHPGTIKSPGNALGQDQPENVQSRRSETLQKPFMLVP